MKLSAKVLLLALMAGAVLFSGCRRKPVRATPDMTMTGGSADANALNPTDLGAFGNDPGLEARTAGFDERGMNRSMFEPVFFDLDRSSIKASEREKITAASKYLQENPDMRLLLEGHCDWRGTAEYNLGLGDRRAAAVRQFLTSLGIGADRLEVLSKGDVDAVENADETQMARDRRVELVVLRPMNGAGAAPISAPAAAPGTTPPPAF